MAARKAGWTASWASKSFVVGNEVSGWEVSTEPFELHRWAVSASFTANGGPSLALGEFVPPYKSPFDAAGQKRESWSRQAGKPNLLELRRG